MTADVMALLIGFAVRAAVVLAFAWGLTIAMRRASASARHIVWTCAIAAAALVPAAALVAPQWEVRSPVSLGTTVAAPQTPVETPAPSARSAESQPTAPTTAPVAALRASIASLDPARTALMVWAAGTLAVLLYLCLGSVSAWRLRRRAAAASSSAADDVRTLAEALEIPQTIAVVDSETATAPMVSGIWRPLIVLPREAAAWSEDRRHVVLLHELAHIKRRDCLTQLLAQVVCAAYWFNPLAWIAARRLRAERERACDDFVLAAGTPRSAYANHLLEIAQAAQPARFSPTAAIAVPMARRSQLEGRLMAILDPATRRSSAFYSRLAAAALVALVSIPAAAVQLVSPRVPARDVALRTVSAIENRSASPVGTPAQTPARGAAQAPARPTPDDRLRYALNKSLVEFANEGDTHGVVAMLTGGADVNAAIDGDGSPLIAASDEGHIEVVRLLLDRGADPNLVVPGDGSALIAAAGEGHADVVRLLLDRGADPNLIAPGDGTALIAAAGDGHIDVMDLLLRRGALVNLIAEGDETALIQAAGDGHLAAVKLLVSKGADVNLGVWVQEQIWVGRDGRNTQGVAENRTELRTPLSEARDDGHLAVVNFLLSAGARD